MSDWPTPAGTSVSNSETDRTSGPLLQRSRQQCRHITRTHYENFLVGTFLLPRALRQPFADIYAFCRTADDLADESKTAQQASAALEQYQVQIDRIFQNQAVDGIFVALADTIRCYELPRQPFDDLLSAFLQDQRKYRYEDESELLDYCQRSANPVGRLVLALSGDHSANNLKLSDQICTGLQLVNFWQDLRRDFQIGRVYLPITIMSSFGFDTKLLADTIQNGSATPQPVRDAIADQCQRIRQRFDEGGDLINNVPSWIAADIELFIAGGLATVSAIEAIDCDVLRYRPTVSKWTQARLLAGVACQRWLPFARGKRHQPVAEVRPSS